MRLNPFQRAGSQPFGRRSAAERLQRGLDHDSWPSQRIAREAEAEAADQHVEPQGETRSEESTRLTAEHIGRQLSPGKEASAGPGGDEASGEAWLRPSRRWPPVRDGEGDSEPSDHDGRGGSGPDAADADAFDAHEASERRRSERASDDEEAGSDLDEIAVTIGRVVSIRGPVIWGALFDDSDGLASRAARMGALVSMKGPDSRVFGIVNALQRDQAAATGNESERTVFEIQVLGEIATSGPEASKGFQRGVSRYPPLDAPITTVTMRDIAAVYARPRASAVHVGRLRHNPKIPAFVLTDSLLGKHFAILGTTGTGKSCAVTVILRSILDIPERPRRAARSPQRVRDRLRGQGGAAQPVEPSAAVLAPELRGDRPHPRGRRRQRARLRPEGDPQGGDPRRQAGLRERRGRRLRRGQRPHHGGHPDPLPSRRSDPGAQGRHGGPEQGRAGGALSQPDRPA